MRPLKGCQPLLWDSEFFGFPVARLEDSLDAAELGRTLNALRREGFRLAYWMPEASPASAESAQAAGATAVGDRVTFLNDTLVGAALAEDPRVQVYEGAPDDPDLGRLGVAAGALSRFAVDPHFPKGSAAQLYHRWIERSARRDLAEVVLVSRAPGGALLGLITLGGDGRIGDIGLLAVDEQARGQGVGTGLVRAALAGFASTGRSAVRVVTQGANEAACRLYRACGFRPVRTQAVWHFWL